jgi:hypothetical protein
MEEVAHLREVLDKIESKLLAASKIYSALQFQLWVVIMTLYYIFTSFMKNVPWHFTALYWSVGFVIFIYLSGLIWKRLRNLQDTAGKSMKNPAAFGWSIAASWITGSLVGWLLVPYLLGSAYPQVAVGIGYLVFISISVLGMFLTILHFEGRVEREMVPAFLIPLLGIAGIGVMQVHPMIYAGFFVALGFSITVVLYIYMAFKTLG